VAPPPAKRNQPVSAPNLTVAWFSFFPVEWLSDIPASVQELPRQHPATWQQVLMDELEKAPGLKLHILVLRSQFPQTISFDRKGVSFHLIRTPGGMRAPLLFWVDTWLIKRRLALIHPHVVHAWGTENGAALVASRLKYPYVVSMQGIFSWSRNLLRLNRYARFVARLEDLALPRAPLVTAESNFAMQYLGTRYPGLCLRQVEHAPKWLFHQVQRRPQTEPFRFLLTGGFDYNKGADLLVQALDQVRQEIPLELVTVGDAKTDLVRWLKKRTTAALWSQERATATLLIHPTRADNSPNSVKEAVVAGVPVVASHIGGIPDYVFPEKNGILFAPGDVAGLAQALRAACRHPLLSRGLVDPDTLAKTRDYLSPERMGREFLTIYQKLAAQRKGD
jgi:glycosyltransferase involved in cell wall biosynthesis